MVSSVNPQTDATRIGWHLWEIDLRFATGLPPEWHSAAVCQSRALGEVPVNYRPGDNPGANDSFFSQLQYKCYLEEVASVGD